MISLYQKLISPLYHFFGRLLIGDSFGCRFTPTCSEYFKTAVLKHGFFGLFLGVWRLLRCNPLFKGGYDPVPDKIA